MIIPLRTDRPPRRKPVMTEALIALNLLVYLAGLIGESLSAFNLETLMHWGAFDPQQFRWWQLVTCMFMHDPSSIWHLAFNMLFLWVFGVSVEDRMTRTGFLVFYLSAGSVTALAHALVSPAPVIGASGAIAGVTGAFLALAPRSRIIVFFLIGMGVIAIPSVLFIGMYFVIDVLRQTGEWLGGNDGHRVAYMAHIGGYVYGFTLAFTLLGLKVIRREEFDVFFLFTQARRRAAMRAATRGTAAGAWDSAAADTGKRLQQFNDDTPLSQEATRHMKARAEINRLAAAHDLPAAATQYESLLHEAPDTVFTEARQLELANQLYSDGRYGPAAAAYELFIDRYPLSGHALEVRLLLAVLYTRQLDRPVRARELIDKVRPTLRDPRQTTLADALLAELPT